MHDKPLGPKDITPTADMADLPVPLDGRDYCGDLEIHIDRNGVWHYQGTPIPRKEMVCLFASTLMRDDAGVYWLVTPSEMGRIEVEDVPFMAVELFSAGAGREQVLSIRTNVDEIVTIDDEHPLEVHTDPETGEPSPYVELRKGIHARLLRSVYYEVVALGLEEKIDGEPFYGVWSDGSFFVMGRLEEGE